MPRYRHVWRRGDDAVSCCLPKDHHEHDEHRPRDAVELRVRIQRCGDLVKPIRHHLDAGGVDLTHRSVSELWNEIAGDLPLVRAHRPNRPLLTAAIRFGTDHFKPTFGVLLEAQRLRLFDCQLGFKLGCDLLRWLPQPPRHLRLHPGQPGAGIRFREKRERLILISSSRVGRSVWSWVTDLPPAGGKLSQPSPCFAFCCGVALRRGTHDALPWTRTDSCGPSCPFVPLAPRQALDPPNSADLKAFSTSRRARWGTTWRARKPEIRVGEHLRSRVEGGRVPPTCLSEWVFLFISVLLCLVDWRHENAPDLRKFADQGREQVFTWGL
ncbi:hypothetical protein ACFPRL_28010 [Pseudoclavibacter helvolus]